MDSKKKMTVGFIFNPTLDQVLLIEKNRPAWQKGFLNGIGGHLTEDEDNMALERKGWLREVKEETGLILDIYKVKRVGMILAEDRTIEVTIFAYHLLDFPQRIKQLTDETVSWVTLEYISMVNVNVIANLKFLIPLALYCFQQPLLKDSSLILEYK